MTTPDTQFHAWNPGLETEPPREILRLSTVFRDDNVSTPFKTAFELSEFCGLPAHELVAFRPERMIIHEVLIHVTTGISVPDGGDYEDLGRNFRDIAAAILSRHVDPHRAEILRAFAQVREEAKAFIARELAEAQKPPQTAAAPMPQGFLRRIFSSEKAPPRVPALSTTDREMAVIARWQAQAECATNPLEAACLEALGKIGTGVFNRQGRLFGNAALLGELALTLVCNERGSEVIGEAVWPYVRDGAQREGFRLLPRQQHPVVMNVKGASASGKSTMRPLQRGLSEKLKLPWPDFALISPDIWRKYLLDYASLGPAYKYAGTLSGHEVEIIDKKLDQRMAARAARADMPHLLIDRFRFDSFVPELEGQGSSRLLTRFGELAYLFFMITPPEATVERAWLRGLKVGRYKAVEDLLAHNVEAYTGMPELFFTWALSATKRVHYEFLDNSVPDGQPPRTVAYGWNTEMTILDVKSMIDIDRFRKIDIHARQPGEVYRGKNLAPEHNVEFLKRCARWIPAINFADHRTGRIYARLENGQWVWRDEAMVAQAMKDPDARAGLTAIAPGISAARSGSPPRSHDFAADKMHTLGRWAEAANQPVN